MNRTAEQIREHYEIEKEIAAQLRNSSGEERTTLYASAYDDLFQQVHHHPQLKTRKDEHQIAVLEREAAILRQFIDKTGVYLEIGPGDCAFAIEMAEHVKKVYAVDVSKEITKNANKMENIELLLSDGTSIPVEDESIDLVYSNQLMEHLHPDDAVKQLANIHRVLKPRGIYFCVTPNRLSGPHDISRTFDPVATCLHLREYTATELDTIFRHVGFSRIKMYFGYGRLGVALPVSSYKVIESILSKLPHSVRKFVTFNRLVRFALGIKLIAHK